MAKVFEVAAVIATALCFSSFLSLAFANFTDNGEIFNVEGKVYCDTCRVEFETRLSEPIDGVKVVLECRARETGVLNYTKESVTDKNGFYNITVEGDHAEEICEIHLGTSPNADCAEVFARDYARILLTTNVGVVEPVRRANALGFRKKEALADCAKVLEEMGFVPEI